MLICRGSFVFACLKADFNLWEKFVSFLSFLCAYGEIYPNRGLESKLWLILIATYMQLSNATEDECFREKKEKDIPWVTSGFVLMFIMVGMLGPYTSASSKPTLSWHFLASATAKLTANSIQSSNNTSLIQIDTIKGYGIKGFLPAVVDLPTPPLPEATAIVSFTPSIRRCFA